MGTLYHRGNLCFTPDGNLLISPVGNRITVFDLINHTTVTLPIETRSNIRCLALSPDGTTLIAIDIDGYALLINFVKRVILSHFNFNGKVYCI